MIDGPSDPGAPAPMPPAPPDRWDRTAGWVMQRGALPALGLLALGLIILYRGLFRGEPAGDDLTFHMAESARIADCLRAGDFDLWNPSANAGFASAYYYQVVPQLASAIPAAVFGHHLFWFQLSVVLPLVLAPAAAYRGMRLLGATPWQATIAALAVGMLNGQSRWGAGNVGTLSVGLYTQTWALAALPIALGHAARWTTGARQLASAIAWSTFVTLCHPFAGVCLAVALVAGVAAQLPLRAVDQLLARISRAWMAPGAGVLGAVKTWLAERWRTPPRRPWLDELGRLAILGGCLAIAWLPIWLPLVIDYDGFGGFPHRVNDEVGPGFGDLLTWYVQGSILDYARPVVLTWSVPIAALFARPRFMRWLWAPAIVYAIWLGLGPHLGKTDDDLIPAVRFLGAMQVVLSLAAGAGVLWIGQWLWDAPLGAPPPSIAHPADGNLDEPTPGEGSIAASLPPPARSSRRRRVAGLVVLAATAALAIASLGVVWAMILFACAGAVSAVLWIGAQLWARRAGASQYAIRTGIAAFAAAVAVLLIVPGAYALGSRVRVLGDFPASHGDELHEITRLLQREPPGRKQVGTGAENHWWNLLSYEYGRRPSLLMMGGGGLQASPNYDFLWTVKDFPKTSWVYDAPILVFEKTNADKMPAGEAIFETKHYAGRRLPAPGLVSPVQVTGTLPPGRKPAHAAAIEWFKTDEPTRDRVLAYDGSGGPGDEPHGTVVRALRQGSPGDAADIYAEVDATAPTTFMARESWHPRWHAYVDRIEVPVRRVTPDFPAVDVRPGHHVVELRFERPWWVHASWLAWPLVSLLAWLFTRRWSTSPIDRS